MAAAFENVPGNAGIGRMNVRVILAIVVPGAKQCLVGIESATMVDSSPLGELAEVVQEGRESNAGGTAGEIGRHGLCISNRNSISLNPAVV